MKGKNLKEWIENGIETMQERLEYTEKWISIMDWETGEFK